MQYYPGRWRTSPLPADWPELRADILARDPICMWGFIPSDGPTIYRIVLQTGQHVCVERSTEVDHIGASDDHRPTSLRGLCSPHHATRTGRQGAEARNKLPNLRLRPKERHPGFRTEGEK